MKDKTAILSVIGSYRYPYDKPVAKRYYDDFFSSPTSLKGDTVYVAVLNKAIVGVVGYFIDRYETGNYWLGWFYVHKDFARNGYGEQMLSFISSRLKKKKVKKLFCNTSSASFYRKAINFYLKNGFKFEAVIKDYYYGGEDQLVMCRKL